MVSGFSDASCLTHYRDTPQDHISTCIACGHPLGLTPSVGSSSYGTSSQAHISSNFGISAHGSSSPADSTSVIVNGHNSPTGYDAPAMHDAYAFSHPAALHQAISPYQRHGHFASMTFNPATLVPLTDLRPYPPIAASTLNHSSTLNQPGPLPNVSFEFYDPNAERLEWGKAKRSCISCFRSKRQCLTDNDQTRCRFCVSERRYCKGVIDIPDLGDTQSWFQSIILRVAGHCSSLDSMIEEASGFDLQVRLNSPIKPGGNHPASMEAERAHVHHIDLRGLRESVSVDNDRSQLLDILDMIFPRSKRPPDSKAYNLEEYEVFIHWRKYYARVHTQLKGNKNLCCHLVACLMILRNLRLSTVDLYLRENPAAPFIVLEFLRQLSREAAFLFRNIIEALKKFLNAPRNKKSFLKQMKSLASHLGLVYGALKLAGSELENTMIPELDFADIPRMPPSLLEKLECLGETFHAQSFRASHVTHSDLVGIHITLFSTGGLPDETTNERRGQSATFLQVINQCFSNDVLPSTTPLDQASPEVNSSLRSFTNPPGSLFQDSFNTESSSNSQTLSDTTDYVNHPNFNAFSVINSNDSLRTNSELFGPFHAHQPVANIRKF